MATVTLINSVPIADGSKQRYTDGYSLELMNEDSDEHAEL
jgi:hypothetical protein